MGRKKAFLLFIFSVLIMSLLPYAVSAQEDEGGIGEGLGSAFNTIKDLFSFLPEMLTLEKLTEGDDAALFWAKFLVWLLLFGVTYFGAGFVFQQNKNITIVVAVAIGLMGALLIPNPMLVDLFKTYGFLSAVIIWMAPAIAGMFLAERITIPIVKGIIYIITLGMVIGLNKALVQNFGLNTSTFPWFGLLVAVLIILSIVNLFRGAWSGGGSAARGLAGRAAGWGWNKLTEPRGDQLPTTAQTAAAAQAAQHAASTTQQARQTVSREISIQQLNAKLGKNEDDLNKKVADVQKKEIGMLNEIVAIINALIAQIGEIDALKRRLMAGDINEVKKRYNDLVNKLIQDLRDLIGGLGQEKNVDGFERLNVLKGLRYDKGVLFEQKKWEFQRRKGNIEKEFEDLGLGEIQWKDVETRIGELEKQLSNLLREEVEYEQGKKTTIGNEETDIDNELTFLQQLLEFIETTIGTGVFGFFKIGKTKGIRLLSIDELGKIKEEIIKCYEKLKVRGNQADIIRTRYTPIENHINASIGLILEQLKASFDQLEVYEKQAAEQRRNKKP